MEEEIKTLEKYINMLSYEDNSEFNYNFIYIEEVAEIIGFLKQINNNFNFEKN